MWVIYTLTKGIGDEPAFALWVPYTLRKQDVVIPEIKSGVRKTTQKYRIEVSTSVDNEYKIDRNNKDIFWREAICKKIHYVRNSFDIIEHDQHVPVGWEKVTGHVVFYVNMDFTTEARWVVD